MNGIFDSLPGCIRRPFHNLRHRAVRRRPRAEFRLELLEPRQMLSAEPLIAMTSVAAAPGSIDVVAGAVTEFKLDYQYGDASTHEILEDPSHDNTYWISGQLHDTIVHFNANTGQSTYFAMPVASGPHGLLFDGAGRLWASLEFQGKVVQVDTSNGAILAEVDVRLNNIAGATGPFNTGPHDISIGPDGVTIWFVGKSTSTLGKINPDRTVQHFQLPSGGATPIYITPGPDGNMWGTELTGNKIFRVTPSGTISEFPIPTFNSRPIAIVPDPAGDPFLWFSEENGHNVARIDMNGVITEFAVPRSQANSILAGLGFDRDHNLYTQSYVDQNHLPPTGIDYIVKLDRSLLTAPPGDLSNVQVTRYPVPSTGTVFHRIIPGDDGNMYFTELARDQVGKLVTADSPAALVIGADNQVYAQAFNASGVSSSDYVLTQPGAVKAIEVGRDVVGNTALFAIGTDDQVYLQRFDSSGTSTGPYSLVGAGAVRAIAVGHDAGNRPVLFVIGADHQVYAHRTDASGNPTGSYFLVAAGAVKSLAVGSDASRHPELFVIGADDQVYALTFTATADPVGGYFLVSPGAASAIAVGRDGSQNPQLFVIGGDNQAYGLNFDAIGHASGGYFLLAAGEIRSLQVGFNAAGQQQLFVTGTDNQVYSSRLNASGTAASPYFLVQAGTVKSLSIARYGAGNPELFVIGSDDQLYTQIFDATGAPLGSYTLTRSGTIRSVRAGF